MSAEADRLAAACIALAARVDDPAVRAQLHALGGVVRNVVLAPAPAAVREQLEARVGAAMAAGDEPSAIAAMRELAALDRASVAAVDWSAASGG
jgi:hypothetical protein